MKTTNLKTLREVSSKVSFPKFLSIGDPLYFQDGDTKYTYEKSFRGKSNWFGEIQLIEREEKYIYEGKECSLEYISIKVLYAPNQVLLDTYKNDQVYSSHKIKTTKIGVDSASYILQVNENGDTINTGSDGLFGGVSEIYKGSKLDGLIIDLDLGDLYDFDTFKEQLEYIFNCKFE